MNISWLQYVLLIHGTQIGVGILTLPRQVAELADTDGWIAIVGGWVIAVFASIGMVKLMQKYPNQSFVDIITACFGKWLGKRIIALYGLYLLASAYIVLIHIIVILKMCRLIFCLVISPLLS